MVKEPTMLHTTIARLLQPPSQLRERVSGQRHTPLTMPEIVEAGDYIPIMHQAMISPCPVI